MLREIMPTSPRKDKHCSKKLIKSAAKKDFNKTLLSKSPNTTSSRMLFMHTPSVQDFNLEKENHENSLLDVTAKVS